MPKGYTCKYFSLRVLLKFGDERKTVPFIAQLEAGVENSETAKSEEPCISYSISMIPTLGSASELSEESV